MMPGQGTSPRTRGKHFNPFQCWCGLGNIPAHAGKTRGYVQYIPPTWEHPRARGENYAYETDRDAGKGTSPRTRGKPARSSYRVFDLRNIPAHAGKTGHRLPPGQHRWEHPRARGENK